MSSAKNVKGEEFDAYASDYREILENCTKNLSGLGSEYFSEYKIQIIKESLDSSPQNILDFGCGDGVSCELFRKFFPNSIITGVDVSPESLKIAENKSIPKTSFVNYDGKELPFESDSFDLVFAACVFHHIEQQHHYCLMKELNRVLRPGGKIFIFEHNPLNPMTRKVVRDCIFDEGVELIYPRTLKKILNDKNFQNSKINYTLFLPRYSIFKKLFPFEKYFRRCCLGAQYYLEANKIN